MKKMLTTIISAIIVGSCLGIFFFKKFDSNIDVFAKNDNKVYAIQVGVYKNYANALKNRDTYDGIVVKDNDLWRVYIDIIKREDILKIMEEIYQENNIGYYVKVVDVNDTFINILNDYELLRLKSDKDNQYILKEKILKEYENVFNQGNE